MAGMCGGVVVVDIETSAGSFELTIPESAKSKRLETHKFKLVPSDRTIQQPKSHPKRIKCENAVQNCKNNCYQFVEDNGGETRMLKRCSSPSLMRIECKGASDCPTLGLTSVCGRRREMEDAVAVHPSFCSGLNDDQIGSDLHFFGVYDGHGCSHVAMKCKDRMHEIMRDEIKSKESSWKETMTRSFSRMDKEVTQPNNSTVIPSNCRCQLQRPQCGAVGSTAVVAILTAEKIIVSNCGDSRAVLSRNGIVIPLSSDHKPDRPDELQRIESSGGKVIYWDGPRVLGVLAMSRAIGDNHLKPYVISEPEVTVIDRAMEDECLILASDGLWDVVSNDTACCVARMCLQARRLAAEEGSVGGDGEWSNKACLDASISLTKLALARHSTDNVSVVVVDLRREGIR